MRRRVLLPALTVLAASSLAFGEPVVDAEADEHCYLVAGVDTPNDPTDDVEACREDVWFHDAGAKVGNVQNAQGAYATFDTTPPSASVTSGAGGGVASSSTSHQFVEPHDPRFAFVAAGTHDGPVDAVAVELYLFPPAGLAQGETTYRVDAQLLIDGIPIGTLADVTVPMETAGSAVQRIQFAFTGLAQSYGFYPGLDLEGEHELELRVHGTGAATSSAVYVYDTTEVPAGMVINPPAALLEAIS